MNVEDIKLRQIENMNEPKFSKGPWEVEHKIDEEGDDIWWVNTPYVEPAAAKCFNPWNAQLIASAPELFEALQRTVERLDDGSAWSDENLDAIKMILARAQGLEEV